MLIAQTAFPALLFVPGAQSLRVIVRAGPYILALIPLLLTVSVRGPRHPARTPALCVLALLTALLANPLSPNIAAAIAHYMLLGSIIAPLFWVPNRIMGPSHLRRLTLILLACNGVNSLVGVLQVYDPDRWMPAEFSAAVMQDLQKYTYKKSDGSKVLRPPGLFDTPGAVAGAGAVAGVVGIVVAATPGKILLRTVAAVTAVIGMTAIYLTYVRASMAVAAVGLMATALVYAARGHMGRAVALLAMVIGGLAVSLSLAVVFAGEGVADRFSTLVESNPTELYYNSRGVGTEWSLSYELQEYPLGAGLGSWGNVAASMGGGGMFAEVQISAWVLDGGYFLLIAYPLLLAVNLCHEIRTGLGCGGQMEGSAAVVIGVNAGNVLLCLTFVPFVCQVGLQYWLLAGALHGAAFNRRVRA